METIAQVVERRGDKLRLSCGRSGPCGGACL
jgi:hypothetical protein